MLSVYIHIPFCKTKCSYCNFYSITSIENVHNLIECEIKELINFSNNLPNYKVQTIYVGGGTPSVLNAKYIEKIIVEIFKLFKVSKNPEISIEVNPDDVTYNVLKDIRNIGFNRISIGVQSLDNKILKFLNRRHTKKQVYIAIDNSVKVGFKNISADLIYGIPGLSNEAWEKTLSEILTLPITHISAYHLSYEKGTKLYSLLKNNIIKELSEEDSLTQYTTLCQILKSNNFIHYEVSNFAKKGFISIHNSNYWNGTFYIGIGPSAHSYLPNYRLWNPSNIKCYIDSWKVNKPCYNYEKISKRKLFNEYLMTRLRTNKGIKINDLKKIDNKLFNLWYKNNFSKNLSFFEKYKNAYRISEEKWLLLDYLLKKIFI
ncbi:MAG: radical SAM family heme chaperone HemW [Bacteroidales bacterium]|nr:radical SAM family heme chaperone HemW [Bacteroidales bacterium]